MRRIGLIVARGMLVGAVCLPVGCADRDLMRESIRAASQRAENTRATRAALELEYPGYKGLSFALLFDKDQQEVIHVHSEVEYKGTEPLTDGRFGGAMRFADGAIIRVKPFLLADNGTYALWFRFLPDANMKKEVRVFDANGFTIMILNGQLRAVFCDMDKMRVLSPNRKVRAGEWSHVAVTWGSGNCTFYVNGERAKTANFSGQPRWAVRTLVLGARFTGRGREFSGDMDEICVYDRELKQGEILALYRKGLNYSDAK